MAMLAMAFPIPAGKTEQWKKFIGELTGARKAEFADSRRSLGVRERTFLQHTPQGDLVLVTLEGDRPETAFAEFAKRADPFTMWFKQQVADPSFTSAMLQVMVVSVDIAIPRQRLIAQIRMPKPV